MTLQHHQADVTAAEKDAEIKRIKEEAEKRERVRRLLLWCFLRFRIDPRGSLTCRPAVDGGQVHGADGPVRLL